MLPSRYFTVLTQPEIAGQLKQNPLVILPCGSTEQHGPHLPTGTDTFAANAISHAVAEQMDALVLPPASLGVTPMHKFWGVSDPMMQQMQMAMFMKNVSMIGGALLISQFGAGPFSLDARRSR